MRTAIVQHVQVKMPQKSESSIGGQSFHVFSIHLLKPLCNNMQSNQKSRCECTLYNNMYYINNQSLYDSLNSPNNHHNL